VFVDGEVIFGSDPESVKVRNIESGSAVTLHLESGDEAVILEGEAIPVSDTATMRAAGEAFESKYGLNVVGDGSEGSWYRVEPRVAFAWLESEFPGTATRFVFGDDAED
jgi:hypothetical protein